MNFKHYNQNQLVLFPYSFQDLILEHHPVRIVNDILDRVNIKPLLKAYSKLSHYQAKNKGMAQ